MSKELALAQETMSKKDFQAVTLQTAQNNGGLRLALNNFAEIEKFACMMATSNFVPKHLRGKPADCLAVTLQSLRWEMDPFAVAQQTYFVSEGGAPGYMAQFINAVILSRAPLKGRPKFTWSGEGENIKCKVTATFSGEDEPAEFEAEMKTITTKNSPNWKQQPKLQLSYYALRAWSRIYCPDVIMGVYTKEEREEMHDITPGSSVQDLNAEFLDIHPDFNPETGEITDAKAETVDEPESLQQRIASACALVTAGDSIDEKIWQVLYKEAKDAGDKDCLGMMNEAVQKAKD